MSDLMGRVPDLVIDSLGCRRRPRGWRIWAVPIEELPEGVITYKRVTVGGVEIALAFAPIKEASDEDRMVEAARVVA